MQRPAGRFRISSSPVPTSVRPFHDRTFGPRKTFVFRANRISITGPAPWPEWEIYSNESPCTYIHMYTFVYTLYEYTLLLNCLKITGRLPICLDGWSLQGQWVWMDETVAILLEYVYNIGCWILKFKILIYFFTCNYCVSTEGVLGCWPNLGYMWLQIDCFLSGFANLTSSLNRFQENSQTFIICLNIILILLKWCYKLM